MAAEALTGQPTGIGEGATTRAAKKGAGLGAAAGIGTGAALASVVVWLLSQFGVDAQGIEMALGTLFEGGLGILGSYHGARIAGAAVPTDRVRRVLVPDTSAQELAREEAAAAVGDPSQVTPAGASDVAASAETDAPVEPLDPVEPQRAGSSAVTPDPEDRTVVVVD